MSNREIRNKIIDKKLIFIKVYKDIDSFISVIKELFKYRIFSKKIIKDKICYYFSFYEVIDAFTLVFWLDGYIYKNIKISCNIGINSFCHFFNNNKNNCKMYEKCYYIHDKDDCIFVKDLEQLKYYNLKNIIFKFISNNYNKILKKLLITKSSENKFLMNYAIKRLHNFNPYLKTHKSQLSIPNKKSLKYENLSESNLDKSIKSSINIVKSKNVSSYLKLYFSNIINDKQFFNDNINNLISNKIGFEYLLKLKNS